MQTRTSRRRFLKTVCGAAAAAALPRLGMAAPKKPNFVFFLVDDLGWADLACFGSKFHETPNIDLLCKSGMKFTNGYAACPVCSPTRASILTGRHPVRVDVTDWIPGAGWKKRKGAKLITPEDRDNLALSGVKCPSPVM